MRRTSKHNSLTEKKLHNNIHSTMFRAERRERENGRAGATRQETESERERNEDTRVSYVCCTWSYGGATVRILLRQLSVLMLEGPFGKRKLTAIPKDIHKKHAQYTHSRYAYTLQ